MLGWMGFPFCVSDNLLIYSQLIEDTVKSGHVPGFLFHSIPGSLTPGLREYCNYICNYTSVASPFEVT